MNKKQFDVLAESLYERGYNYKKYNQQWHHEDYVIGKGFHKKDNKWEEGRNAYQIILFIYDYTLRTEFWDRIPEDMRNYVGIEVHVDMSRTIGERLDLSFAWHDNDTIEEVEQWAEEYYQFMCKLFKEPREY